MKNRKLISSSPEKLPDRHLAQNYQKCWRADNSLRQIAGAWNKRDGVDGEAEHL